MKKFNLEEYLRLKEEGREPKIITRCGRSVQIIHTNKQGVQPVVALISFDILHTQEVYTFHADGCFNCTKKQSNYDLFFVTTKYKGWTNVYSRCGTRTFGELYDTEDEAKKFGKLNENYITTIPIEWEE